MYIYINIYIYIYLCYVYIFSTFPLFDYFLPAQRVLLQAFDTDFIAENFFFVSTTGILHFVLWLIPPIKCSGNYCLAMRSPSL